MNFFERLWRRITFDERRRRVRLTVPHPVFGDMHFFGRRGIRDDVISGWWQLTPPGFTRHLTVIFPTPGGTLDDGDLARLQAILDDLDALFERIRPHIVEEYAHWVGEPLPSDWRDAFRLDSIDLPDVEMGEDQWTVGYWCEGAQHWFEIELHGNEVTYVSVEG